MLSGRSAVVFQERVAEESSYCASCSSIRKGILSRQDLQTFLLGVKRWLLESPINGCVTSDMLERHWLLTHNCLLKYSADLSRDTAHCLLLWTLLDNLGLIHLSIWFVMHDRQSMILLYQVGTRGDMLAPRDDMLPRSYDRELPYLQFDIYASTTSVADFILLSILVTQLCGVNRKIPKMISISQTTGCSITHAYCNLESLPCLRIFTCTR